MAVREERRAAVRDAARRPPAIVRPGQNCWELAHAHRFACIQDGADYFRLAREAMLQARQTVFIVGWDLQPTVDLLPGSPEDDPPTRLDRLLAFIVARRPKLRCYLLIWDHAALYTLERDPFTRWRLGWRTPRQVRFGFDDHHPVGGSHHQKILVVDDALAFCGGIDLTGHRWDTSAHRVEEPARTTALGAAYGPYHEVQAMLNGPAAARLGGLVRDRWRVLGEQPPAVATGTTDDDRWLDGVAADLEDVDVAIARTVPASEQGAGVRECERLFADSIAAARDAIYLESQYFTNERLAAALAERLREPDGPEVIAVIPRECHGWLERQTMGALREEMCRHLCDADRHGRLRLVYPAASRAADVPTFVHSKVMIVDDTFVRIGSANLSRRSMGVDTECDVAVELAADSPKRDGIRRIRARLLAEHLGMAPDEIEPAIAEHGSLRAVVDRHADGDHTLVPIVLDGTIEKPGPALHTAADPDEPIHVGAAVAELVPPLDARAGRGRVRVWLPVIVSGLSVLAVTTVAGAAGVGTLRTLLDLAPGGARSVVAGLVVFLVGQAVLIPMEILAIGCGIVLGLGQGSLVAIAGAWLAAALGYVVGRLMRPADLSRWMSRRAYRSTRQLGARGIGGVVALRLTSVASATSVHLMCGAGRVPFPTYMAGSIAGLTPVVAVLSGLGGLVRHAVLQPSWAAWAGAGAVALGVAAGAALLRTVFLVRQFAPSVSRHQTRAEFG